MCGHGRCRRADYYDVQYFQEYLQTATNSRSVVRDTGSMFLDLRGYGYVTVPVLLRLRKAKLSRGGIICGWGIIVEENLLCYNR